MQNDIPLRQRALHLIAQLRQRLIDPSFGARHRRRPTDFTRQCVLIFPVLMLLLLQKSLKSLQAHLHEFLAQLAEGAHAPNLSGGALTHARAKLNASAFVELNTAVVLATSLLDEAAYPTEEFGPLYWRRWGHETYYGRLKGRLDLEHCSGQTVAAVEQDFQATVLLSNVESVVVGPAQAELRVRTAGRAQPAQVNRAVSLNALKSRLIALLTSRVPAEQVLAELTEWFQANPVSVRPGRTVRRREFSPSRSYHYQRRVRKLVF